MATESNLLWLWLNILSGYVKWEYWCESFKDWWEVVTTIFSDPGVKKKELFVWVTEAVARVYWCQGPVRRGQGGHVWGLVSLTDLRVLSRDFGEWAQEDRKYLLSNSLWCGRIVQDNKNTLKKINFLQKKRMH